MRDVVCSRRDVSRRLVSEDVFLLVMVHLNCPGWLGGLAAYAQLGGSGASPAPSCCHSMADSFPFFCSKDPRLAQWSSGGISCHVKWVTCSPFWLRHLCWGYRQLQGLSSIAARSLSQQLPLPFASHLLPAYDGSRAVLGRCCSANGIPAKGAITFGRQ